MRTLIVTEFMSLDGVVDSPGGTGGTYCVSAGAGTTAGAWIGWPAR